MKFRELSLAGTVEVGSLDVYAQYKPNRCRPFNRLSVDGNVVVKEGINEQGRNLAADECLWYETMMEKDVSFIPKIYGLSPLEMEYVGESIDEHSLSHDEKKEVLSKIIEKLHELHELETVPADSFSISEAYYFKTLKRIYSVQNLIPFSNRPYITINGKKCRNVLFFKDEFRKAVEKLQCQTFHIIHGDCTFSNILLRDDREPVLIDPRGYFGHTKIYGDPMYDWAKLYYSLVGNYDKFNVGKKSLQINGEEVFLEIESNHWEDLEGIFFALTGADPWKIKLIHGIIWLSFTTYIWQDYDSICGAFYNGLCCLEDVL